MGSKREKLRPDKFQVVIFHVNSTWKLPFGSANSEFDSKLSASKLVDQHVNSGCQSRILPRTAVDCWVTQGVQHLFNEVIINDHTTP